MAAMICKVLPRLCLPGPRRASVVDPGRRADRTTGMRPGSPTTCPGLSLPRAPCRKPHDGIALPFGVTTLAGPPVTAGDTTAVAV
jgi:hypothetical protein